MQPIRAERANAIEKRVMRVQFPGRLPAKKEHGERERERERGEEQDRER